MITIFNTTLNPTPSITGNSTCFPACESGLCQKKPGLFPLVWSIDIPKTATGQRHFLGEKKIENGLYVFTPILFDFTN